MFDSMRNRKHRSRGSRPGRRAFLSGPAIVERLEDRRLLTAFTFANSAGGDWDTASNWNPNTGFPGSVGTADTATIDNTALGVPSLDVSHNQSINDQIAGLSLANNSTLDIGGGGSIVTSALSFNNGGTLNVNPGGSLGLNGAAIAGTGGTLNVKNGGTIDAMGSVSFGSAAISMAIDSTLDVVASSNAAANLTLPLSFSNPGTISLQQTDSGTSDSATLTVPSGGTLTNTGAIVTRGGVNGIGGSRTIATMSNPLDNQGILAPGGEGPGTLNVTGGLTLESNSALNINLGGTTSGTSSLVAATGAATLNGTLNLHALDTFFHKNGDTITILTASSITGQFSTINLFQEPNPNSSTVLTAKVSYSSTAVTVTFISIPPATDFFTNANNDAKWDEAGNWSDGLPTQSTMAVIDAAQLTNPLNGNPVLINPGANNTDAAGTLTDTDGIGLTIQSGTLAIGGFAGVSSLTGVTVNGPGTLHVIEATLDELDDQTILSGDTINSPLTNDAIISVVDANTTVTGAFINNAFDGEINISSNVVNGDNASLTVANLTNNGSIELNQDLSQTPRVFIGSSSSLFLQDANSILTNNGSIGSFMTVFPGIAEIFLNGGKVINNGSVSIQNFSFPAGQPAPSFTLQGGTIDDNGEMAGSLNTIQGGGTFNFNPSAPSYPAAIP